MTSRGERAREFSARYSQTELFQMGSSSQKDNILLMPGVTGFFSHDVTSDVTVGNGLDQLIWGFRPNEEYDFERAKQAVHKDYRQMFHDKSLGSIGKATSVEFELVLANGYRTLEKYIIIGHDDDNEITNSPITIEGSTTLLSKVA